MLTERHRIEKKLRQIEKKLNLLLRVAVRLLTMDEAALREQGYSASADINRDLAAECERAAKEGK